MTDLKVFHVVYSVKAQKQLRKLDNFTRKTILLWLDKNINGKSNPRAHGKALTANHSGEWRYRVGDYRILVKILEDVVSVEVFAIGHRRDIY